MLKFQERAETKKKYEQYVKELWALEMAAS